MVSPFHSWNFLSSIGSGITFLSFAIFFSIANRKKGKLDPIENWQKTRSPVCRTSLFSYKLADFWLCQREWKRPTEWFRDLYPLSTGHHSQGLLLFIQRVVFDRWLIQIFSLTGARTFLTRLLFVCWASTEMSSCKTEHNYWFQASLCLTAWKINNYSCWVNRPAVSIFGPFDRNCRRTLLTQLTDRF